MEKAYEGVKFKTEFVGKNIPLDSRIEELKYWCKTFHEKNLAPAYLGGSYGNLSFRVKDNQDEFIITGSSIGMKDKLTNDCFVKVISCDLENKTVYCQGIKQPSSESMLHDAIYKNRKDVNSIFHGHCESITSNIKKLNILETKKEESCGTKELINSVLEILEKYNFLQMKNHGFISLGKNMHQAGELTLYMHMKSL